MSYIYFIQAKGDGPVKVGFTGDNPARRMVKIQSDCPWPVRLLGAIKGTIAQEKQIHFLLARWRTQGEWFYPHPIVLAAVNEAMACGELVTPPKRKRKGPKYNHALCRYRHEHNLTLQDIADQTGIHRVSLCRYEQGNQKPSDEALKAIIAATGLTIFDLRPDLVQIRSAAQ